MVTLGAVVQLFRGELHMGIRTNEMMIVKNRLTQVGKSFKSRRGARSAVFVCECGIRKIVDLSHVKTGHTKSCGCHSSEIIIARNTIHGRTKTPEYVAWCSMLQRVRGTSCPSRYKDRGITCCDRWQTFENFLEDMGNRPSSRHSLDRIDNDANYCKENCRWATSSEQNQNKANSVKLTFDGVTMCLTEWERKLGIRLKTLGERLKKGWSVEKALTTPVRSNRKSKDKA